MGAYTKEEAKQIVQGLLSGHRSGRPMSDAEFEARYDPQKHHEKRTQALLERIAFALENLVQFQLPIHQERPYEERQAKPPTGPVEL